MQTDRSDSEKGEVKVKTMFNLNHVQLCPVRLLQKEIQSWNGNWERDLRNDCKLKWRLKWKNNTEALKVQRLHLHQSMGNIFRKSNKVTEVVELGIRFELLVKSKSGVCSLMGSAGETVACGSACIEGTSKKHDHAAL